MATSKTRIVATLVAAFATASVCAQPAEILGRKILVPPPQGYCAFGETEKERQHFAEYKQQLAFSGEVLVLAVPCEELARFNREDFEYFDRWMTVKAVFQGGRVRLDTRPLSEFLRSLPLRTAAAQFEQMREAISTRLAESGVAGSIDSVKPAGVDSLAGYWIVSGSQTFEEKGQVPWAGVMAGTLVSGVPLAIQSYAAKDAKPGLEPVELVRLAVQAVHTANRLAR